MPKQIRLNAFDMNCVGHQSPGLWTHPRDRADRYNTLDYWVELAKLLGYGMPEAEIHLLIKHPQTGEPISLETLRKHFAEEIATGAVKAKALVGDRIVAWILGRDGGLQDDRARVRLAILYAKTRMGWTVANRHQHVGPPIDAEDARRRLDKKIDRLVRGLKAGGTGGSSAG